VEGLVFMQLLAEKVAQLGEQVVDHDQVEGLVFLQLGVQMVEWREAQMVVVEQIDWFSVFFHLF